MKLISLIQPIQRMMPCIKVATLSTDTTKSKIINLQPSQNTKSNFQNSTSLTKKMIVVKFTKKMLSIFAN